MHLSLIKPYIKHFRRKCRKKQPYNSFCDIMNGVLKSESYTKVLTQSLPVLERTCGIVEDVQDWNREFLWTL